MAPNPAAPERPGLRASVVGDRALRRADILPGIARKTFPGIHVPYSRDTHKSRRAEPVSVDDGPRRLSVDEPA